MTFEEYAEKYGNERKLSREAIATLKAAGVAMDKTLSEAITDEKEDNKMKSFSKIAAQGVS